MKRTIFPYILVIGFLLIGPHLSAVILMDTRIVGNPGNAWDTSMLGLPISNTPFGSPGFGRVDYEYHIGTYPVTNAQYALFLNSVARVSDPHGLWNPRNPNAVSGGVLRGGNPGDFHYIATPGMENHPVVWVSFWDAARFANWLTTGNTERGVYMLTPEGIANNSISRDPVAWANGGVAIASENEWYKAAYYDPTLNENEGGYWLFSTRSNTMPNAIPPNNTDPNSANLHNVMGGLTDVGAYELAKSYYGTFDQTGNVWEWNESRGIRGGSHLSRTDSPVASAHFGGARPPHEEEAIFGFRVTSLQPIVIPEPSTYAVILGVAIFCFSIALRRRRF